MRSWPVRVALVVLVASFAAGCDWTSFGFSSAGGRFNTTETAIGVGNVANLTAAWTASGHFSSSPTVARGVVYVTGDTDQLEAFDATGSRGCSAAPKSCTPLWTGTTGASTESTPAVANGVVYVGSGDGKLYAFDASGTTGCSGTPKTCLPLWTAGTGDQIVSSPVVVNGVVYVGSYDEHLYAFDASGTVGCSGAPKTCAPLWTAPTAGPVSSSPAVAGGVLYVGADSIDGLYAFDASGSTGCSGTPKTCTPLWRGDATAVPESSPAVASGVVYVGSDEDRALFAFDASGSKGCSGTPKVCEPLWTGPTNYHLLSSPAVTRGKVLIGARGLNTVGVNVLEFDASGTTGCSGTPKTCSPLWSTGETNFVVNSSPAVANGVVYNSSSDGNVYAYNATTGSQLWTATIGALFSQSPTVANGVLYVTSFTGLAAFTP